MPYITSIISPDFALLDLSKSNIDGTTTCGVLDFAFSSTSSDDSLGGKSDQLVITDKFGSLYIGYFAGCVAQ